MLLFPSVLGGNTYFCYNSYKRENEMKAKLILTLGLMTFATVSWAECSKSEMTKLLHEGFLKVEIDSICGIRTNDTVKPNFKSKWISPSNSTCLAKGGKFYDGTCGANWQEAKNICSASGGRLPSLNELIDVIKECGGVVANFDSDGKKVYPKKLEKNMENSKYQSCYKENGFLSSGNYWSSSQVVSDAKHAWSVGFLSGGMDGNSKLLGHSVRCVRHR